MVASGPHDRKGIGILTILTIAALCFALYVLLRQDVFYREDGYQLVHHHLAKGRSWHDVHPLYLPVLAWFQRLVSMEGWNEFEVASMFSAASVAFCVLMVGLTARRAGLQAREGVPWMLLTGLCPGVTFFATVVEFHGFFLAFVGICFWQAERLVSGEPPPHRWLSAGLLGLGTALATAAHASGHLLVPLLGAWVIARRDRLDRLPELIAFAATHMVLYLVGLAVVDVVLGLPRHAAGRSAEWLSEWIDVGAIFGRVLPSLWHEVLVPFAPLNLALVWTVLRAWPNPPTLLQVRVGAAAFGLYWLAALLILADPNDGSAIVEHGAYLLPLAIPAAYWVARRLEPVWLDLLVLASLALAWNAIDLHGYENRGQQDAAMAAGFATLGLGPEDVVICGPEESMGLYIQGATCKQVMVLDCAEWSSGTAAGVVVKMREQLAEGRRILVTQRALDLLGDARLGPEAQIFGVALMQFERGPAVVGNGAVLELHP
ncbi:MAG: hypothetical protein R3F30_07220 [Planctomycetota bacterium]